MKRIWAVMAMLLLAGCGSGGSGAKPVDVTGQNFTGILSVRITEGNAKQAAAFVPGPGKHYRVVVRNQGLILNNQFFSAIQDGNPGDVIGFSLPVANGYTVEAISYVTDATTGLNMVQQYAKASGVSIDASGVASQVDLPLTPIVAELILPKAVVQGAKYNMVQPRYSTALGRTATPLNSNWYLVKPKTTSFAPFTNITSTTVFASTNRFDAPVTYGVPTNIFFQGVFTLKPTLLKTDGTESLKQWVFNSAESSMPVTADVNVNITLP